MGPRSVVSVGAGLAGARCAEALRAGGFDGALTMIGDEELPPYDRPALSKEYLAGRKEEHGLLLRPQASVRGAGRRPGAAHGRGRCSAHQRERDPL